MGPDIGFTLGERATRWSFYCAVVTRKRKPEILLWHKDIGRTIREGREMGISTVKDVEGVR